jgi:UDP-N-acetylmuramoylalanine--D-glutamate ligase
VCLADDADTPEIRAAAAGLGLDLVVAPDPTSALDGVDLLAPAPGLPERHPTILEALSRGVPVRSEIDLAYEWEQARPGGPRPMVAITGTDGKTSTTELAAAMLRAGGWSAAVAGNTDVPLVAAIDDDVDVFVVECSSFRLRFTNCFRAEASVWLNLAPDHQNWHPDMDAYEASKARLWRHVRPDDVAVGNAGDATVMRNLAQVSCRQRTFAAEAADYHVADGLLVGPGGPIATVSSMRRSLPHDCTNALAASALVLETGLADEAAVAAALAEFRGPPHRIELVAEADGIAWYDDSKATSPHAALAAIRSFASVVLLAGGRNKGLDLRELAEGAGHVRAVVAFGEARHEVAAAFTGHRPVLVADSFEHAVELGSDTARPGDVVLLSPACASFDTHRNYGERGDDFARLVRQRLDQGERP